MEYPNSPIPLKTRIFGVEKVKKKLVVLILNWKYQYES